MRTHEESGSTQCRTGSSSYAPIRVEWMSKRVDSGTAGQFIGKLHMTLPVADPQRQQRVRSNGVNDRALVRYIISVRLTCCCRVQLAVVA